MGPFQKTDCEGVVIILASAPMQRLIEILDHLIFVTCRPSTVKGQYCEHRRRGIYMCGSGVRACGRKALTLESMSRPSRATNPKPRHNVDILSLYPCQ